MYKYVYLHNMHTPFPKTLTPSTAITAIQIRILHLSSVEQIRKATVVHVSARVREIGLGAAASQYVQKAKVVNTLYSINSLFFFETEYGLVSL